MQKLSLLVVEDDADIRKLLCHTLTKEGYEVVLVGSGEEALEAIARQMPGVVILDLMLPGLDGLAVCRRLRAYPQTANIPIIMLTAKGEEGDIVTGLNAGANDYVTKPFSPKVLCARVRAMLRRPETTAAAVSQDQGAEVIQIHNITVHTGRHEVRVDDRPIELSATEFRLLHFLAKRAGWVFTREQILEGLHGDRHAITDRAVDVQVVGLRRHLGSAAQYLETVRGVGYRFKE
jgi:two-component system phosphate regulon response regulator PhoB